MKLLVARFKFNQWKRIGILYPRKDGTCSFPKSMHGQLSCHFAKQAIRSMKANDGIDSLDYEFGTHQYRVSSI